MRVSNRLRALWVPLAAAALLGACDTTMDVDPHLAPEGFVILHGEQALLTYMLDDTQVPTLTLTAGTLYDVVVRMLDHDGHPIEHGDDDEEELHVIFAQPIVTWTPEAHQTGTADEHQYLEFHGEMNAVEAGNTTLFVGLLHGDHYDFQSASIPVVVEAAGTGS